MWISVWYHTNSAPNQWIAECGMQNAQCSHLLPSSDARCPLNHTRSLPSFIKSRLLRLQVVTTGWLTSRPKPDVTSCTDSYQQWLSTQQCPTSSATVAHVLWVTTVTSSVTACVALHSTGWLAGCVKQLHTINLLLPSDQLLVLWKCEQRVGSLKVPVYVKID